MSANPLQNPLQYRRPALALLLKLIYPALACSLKLIQMAEFLELIKKSKSHPSKAVLKKDRALPLITFFQSYQVGDFFMAFPAILKASEVGEIQVVCRPDCCFVLNRLGILALPFLHPAYSTPILSSKSIAAWLTSLRSAWSLRKHNLGLLIDFDADPRSAFLMRIAGAQRIVAYSRPQAFFFDKTLTLSSHIRHQQEKNMALVELFLFNKNGTTQSLPANSQQVDVNKSSPLTIKSASTEIKFANRIILSCWTSKDTKNWPLKYWKQVIQSLCDQKITDLALLSPLGASPEYYEFEKEISQHLPLLRGNLEEVYDWVDNCAGIVTQDNFLGHLGAWLQKPIFWINGSSKTDHIQPFSTQLTQIQLEPMPCRPCHHRCVNNNYKECLTGLHPHLVLSKLQVWLNERL